MFGQRVNKFKGLFFQQSYKLIKRKIKCFYKRNTHWSLEIELYALCKTLKKKIPIFVQYCMMEEKR